MEENKLPASLESLERELKVRKAEVEAKLNDLKSMLGYIQPRVEADQKELEQLKKGPQTPETQHRIQILEKKMGIIMPVLKAADALPGLSGGSLVNAPPEVSKRMTGQLNLEISITECEMVVANAQQYLAMLAPKIEVLRFLTNQPARVPAEFQGPARQFKAKLAQKPAVLQSVQRAIHFYDEAVALYRSEAPQVANLRTMEKRDVAQLLPALKTAPLAGKMNNLRKLHELFQGEPSLAEFFAPIPEVDIPLNSAPTSKSTSKPLTGRLMDMLGLGKQG
ncbi:hypothetical protein D3C72_176050 [compost metagenome]